MPDARHEQNRASWNVATARHLEHRPDRAQHLRAWRLHDEERELLGDVRGRSVLHVQCNDGFDTLGLAALGAEATGVDISDVAIETARTLSAESGIPARFERGDVLDWLPAAAVRGKRWDVAFASYGALCWISDLHAWMRAIAGVLAPGGRLVCVEHHPLLYVFDEGWRVARPYFGTGGQHWDEGVGDYVGATNGDAASLTWVNPVPCVEFQWPIGEVLGALLDAGLVLERFAEHPHSNGWRPLPEMVSDDGVRFRLPDGRDLPLMYSLSARLPAGGSGG